MKTSKASVWIKLAITITFVLGACIFLYPFIANVVNTQVDRYRIHKFNKELEANESKQLAKKKAREKELKENPHLGMELDKDIFDEVEKSNKLSSKEIEEHLIGSIVIPKINERLPVFDETTASFLQEGITLLPGASYPNGGESTHSVLTGHTGLADKKLFTDLKQLTKGDVFYINILGEVLAYQVNQIKTVLPDQMEDLEIEEGKDFLTLVTCTPYMVNTHRLLVRGERIPFDASKMIEKEKEVNRKNLRDIVMYSVLIIALLFLLLSVIIRQINVYRKLRRNYTIDFKVLYQGHPLKFTEFLLFNDNNKPLIDSSGNQIMLTSNENGVIYSDNLKGQKLRLVQQDIRRPLKLKLSVNKVKNSYFMTKMPKKYQNEFEILEKKEL
ncbi:class C sortase [Vagococcus fluvialis]|uniref:class C sortase n=1 Tax=Vagococcus fluvialis TaxID=2738 RepID=UPI003B5BFC2B